MAEQQNETPLSVTEQNGVLMVELTDRKILDEVNIGRIGEELNTLVMQADDVKIVIDFANVSHMSSSALGMLIMVHKRVCEKAGKLRFCNIQPSILEVFEITRLDKIFQISQSRGEALASLS